MQAKRPGGVGPEQRPTPGVSSTMRPTAAEPQPITSLRVR